MADDSGQDKTEEPTDKKKQDSREQGQVANSREVSSLGVLSAVGGAAMAWFPGMVQQIQSLCVDVLVDGAGHSEAFVSDLPGLLAKSVVVILTMVGPLLLGATVAAFALTAGQVGFVWSWKALEFKPDRLDPIQGIKNKMFSSNAVVEWVKSLLKVILVAAVAYNVALGWMDGLEQLSMKDLDGGLRWTVAVLLRLVAYTLLPMVILAAADLVFQRWNTNEKMKMTREEVKREHKESDGDPHMKAKRRQKAMQISQNRMLAEVAEATVVVTNPSHYAVALKYELGQGTPPIVVAAGVDALAEKIKELARTAGVPRVENRPLARALYSTSPVGHPIAHELFDAVAEVLAFVFRLKNRHGPGATA